MLLVLEGCVATGVFLPDELDVGVAFCVADGVFSTGETGTEVTEGLVLGVSSSGEAGVGVAESDSAVDGREGVSAAGASAVSLVELTGEELQLLRVRMIAPARKGAKCFLRRFIT